jgi:hypothetical protein
MKLEHTTTTEGDFFEITDARGQTVWLTPEEALLVADWINQRRGGIYALVHPESVPPFTQQTRPDASTRFRASWVDDLEV